LFLETRVAVMVGVANKSARWRKK